jgi:hypothetical protein
VSAIGLDKLPAATCGLKLHKITPKGELIACESVFFTRGRDGVNTVLRRAGLSGRVEVAPDGDLPDFFADVLTSESGDWDASVALDRNSYRALKNHWMRCKLEPAHSPKEKPHVQ